MPATVTGDNAIGKKKAPHYFKWNIRACMTRMVVLGPFPSQFSLAQNKNPQTMRNSSNLSIFLITLLLCVLWNGIRGSPTEEQIPILGSESSSAEPEPEQPKWSCPPQDASTPPQSLAAWLSSKAPHSGDQFHCLYKVRHRTGEYVQCFYGSASGKLVFWETPSCSEWAVR